MVKPALIRPRQTDINLRSMFEAIVDYHNNLVYMRFTVAGLYLAATGFLASSWFSGSGRQEAYCAIPILGITLTVVCWLLEKRTTQLLENLDDRGLIIETELKVAAAIGFFSLMREQDIEARFPFIRPPRSKPSKALQRRSSKPLQRRLLTVLHYIVSHTFGLDMLYGSILVFWIFMLRLA